VFAFGQRESARVVGCAVEALRDRCGDREMFRPLIENLWNHDPFLVLADHADYLACHGRVDAAWSDPGRRARKSILNTARSGKFSADRAIGEYCKRIWRKPARFRWRWRAEPAMRCFRPLLALWLPALPVQIAGCAQIRMGAQWPAPDLAPGALKGARVVVPCQAPLETEPRVCADALAAQLSARGLDPRVGEPILQGAKPDVPMCSGPPAGRKRPAPEPPWPQRLPWPS
jgi:hypothetical protein